MAPLGIDTAGFEFAPHPPQGPRASDRLPPSVPPLIMEAGGRFELHPAQPIAAEHSGCAPPQDAAAEAAAFDPSRIWLPELTYHLAGGLSPNEVACTLRLVNKATAAQLRGPQHTSVRLSQPVPHHAYRWRWGGEEALSSLTRAQREQLPLLAARSGSAANLQVLHAHGDRFACVTTDVLKAAAAAGALEVCRWLRQRGCPLNRSLFCVAAEGGHRAVCEWLLDSGCCPWHMAAAGLAARGGHVGLMDWLLGKCQLPDAGSFLEEVAKGCDLPTLERLHRACRRHASAGLCGTQEMAVAYAAGSPTADWRAKVEWLEGRGCPRTAWAAIEAARQPDARQRLEWLRARGYPLGPDAAWTAAYSGAAEALRYLLDAGVEMDEERACNSVMGATRGSHLAVLQVLHERGVLARVAGSYDAAAHAAASAGHLPVLAWLVEARGAARVLTAELFTSAAASGDTGLLAWLRERGCPMGEHGKPYRQALLAGDLAMLRCLRRLGCPWGGAAGRVFTSAVSACGDGSIHSRAALPTLEWLLAQGCPVDWGAAEAVAVGHRNDAVLAWLREPRGRPLRQA